MRHTPTLLAAGALVALALAASSASAAARKGPRAASPATNAAAPWDLFPAPDTALVRRDGNAPTSQDTLYEIALEDRGVNFGADGSVAVVSWKVFLPLTRRGADQLTRLPSAPPGENNSTTAFLVHADGEAQAASGVKNGVVGFDRVLPGDLVYVGVKAVQAGPRPGVPAPFSMLAAFPEGHPVRHSRLWVRYPQGHAPGLRTFALGAPDSSVKDGAVLLQWRRDRLPASPAEPASIGALDGTPAAIVATRADLDWLGPLLRSALRLPAGPRLKKVAEAIKAEPGSRDQVLDMARGYVALQVQALRNESVDYDSLRRLTPDGVLLRGAAGPFGKSILLAGLLKQLGFQPAIALVEPRRLWDAPPALDPEFVSPVVAVPALKPNRWINPVSLSTPTHRVEIPLQGLRATVVGPDRTLPGVEIPRADMDHRGTAVRITGTADPGGVVAGDLRAVFRDCDADLWRSALQAGTVAMASRALQSLASQALFASETQDAKGEGFEVPGDSAALFSAFRARDLMDRVADTVSLRLPSRPVPELEPGPRAAARDLLRTYGRHDVRIDLQLPANWTLRNGSDSSAADGRYLRWSDARRVEGGRLLFTRTLWVLQTVLPAADVEVYRREEKAMQLAFDRPVEFRVPSR